MLSSRCVPFITVCMCGFVCLVFTPTTDKVPHFSRLGDVEVNAGQNASFQCVATGKVSEIEPFLLEVRTSCLFYYLCFNGQSTSQHLDNRIGLEIVGRGGNTKDKERDVFTRLAFSWQSYPEQPTVIPFACTAAGQTPVLSFIPAAVYMGFSYCDPVTWLWLLHVMLNNNTRPFLRVNMSPRPQSEKWESLFGATPGAVFFKINSLKVSFLQDWRLVCVPPLQTWLV